MLRGAASAALLVEAGQPGCPRLRSNLCKPAWVHVEFTMWQFFWLASCTWWGKKSNYPNPGMFAQTLLRGVIQKFHFPVMSMPFCDVRPSDYHKSRLRHFRLSYSLSLHQFRWVSLSSRPQPSDRWWRHQERQAKPSAAQGAKVFATSTERKLWLVWSFLKRPRPILDQKSLWKPWVIVN